MGTILGVTRKPGIHRRMVREALGDAVPRQRTVAIRPRPKLAAAMDPRHLVDITAIRHPSDVYR